MTKQKTVLLLSLILVAYLVGRFSGHDAKPGATAAAETTAVTEYTCSMHPQIRQPGPGLCPICAMDLIPVSEDQKPSGPRSLSLTDAARALARIETAPVTRGAATVVISLTGSLRYPTERAREIALNTEVQIRNVLTPLDGTRVSAGQALAELYSPDVFSAMRELANAGPNGTLVNAARQKLHLIGLSDRDIEAISASDRTSDTFTIHSTGNGLITGIPHHSGEWLMSGMELTRLIDDSTLRAELDVYASDSSLIKSGQTARLSITGSPGINMTGIVSSVGAETDDMTRTRKVFVDVPNPAFQLRPGIFVQAIIHADIPGEHLLIPATAVLMTGSRAVVYVQSPSDSSTFESRIITPGPRAGDEYMIISGLSAGERVVTRGAMKLDSTMQLMAKPSMMSMPSESGTITTRPQTICPVEGGEIDKDVHVDYGGYRIYFCCPGCDTEFLAAPDEWINRMKAEGIELEKAPASERMDPAS